MGHAQQGLDFVVALRVKAFEQVAPHQSFGLVLHQPHGGHIGLGHFLAECFNHHDGIIGGVKQNAVTRFDVAQAQIVAFHGLLGFHQTPLQHSNGPQVPAQQQGALFFLEMQGHILDGQILALQRRMVDVPPAHIGIVAGYSQHFLDLGHAFRGDRAQPGLADPGLTGHGGQLVFAHRNINHHAVLVHQQRNIGCHPDQLG